MSFGDILDKWDSDRRDSDSPGDARQEYEEMMRRWLESEKIPQKEEDLIPRGKKNPARKTVRRMAPQDTIDLHGYIVAEALEELEGFLKRAKRRGLRKILVIHGKGRHSESGESILRREVRNFIRNSPLCGESGVPQPNMGGEGAVWVILR